MGWKEDAKGSSWNFNKDSSWNVPIDNFKIKVEGNKIQYNEGTWISSADDPHFDYPLSGPPITDDHIPCGYWHRDYAPMVYEIVTSELYPYEADEWISVGDGTITGGVFKAIYHSYNYQEKINTTIAGVTGGSFRSILSSYDYWPPEDINTTVADITGGVFKLVLYSYTYWPAENINTTVADITGGVFNDVLISYEFWPTENIDTIEGHITGGVHATA